MSVVPIDKPKTSIPTPSGLYEYIWALGSAMPDWATKLLLLYCSFSNRRGTPSEAFPSLVLESAVVALFLVRARTVLATNASSTAVGGVLQQAVSEELMPIAFFSQCLQSPQFKWFQSTRGDTKLRNTGFIGSPLPVSFFSSLSPRLTYKCGVMYLVVVFRSNT